MAALGFAATAFAGSAKNGGTSQILLDSVNSSGGIATAGDSKLYSSIGQQSAPAVNNSNGYTLMGGFLAVVDETPPTVVITAPAASAGISGQIAIAGTAYDANGLTWTLYYGPGESPAVWKQISSGNQNITDNELAQWDSSERKGAYTLKIVAVDSRGNTSEGTVVIGVSNTITISGNLPAFKWMILSTPVEPAVADPATMFGTGEYKVYRWDPDVETTNERQGKNRLPSELHAGNGFWIKAFFDDHAYSFDGSVVDTTRDFVVTVKDGWNQIGTPYDREFPWEQVRVRHGGTEYDLSTAASMGFISSTLQGYDPDANSWVQLGINDNMQPRTGYFMRAYGESQLLFGPGAGLPGGVRRVVAPVYDFRMQISASTTNAADIDNYIGLSSSASTGYDILDAEEPPLSPEDSYISLYFSDNDPASGVARYANDIRPLLRAAEFSGWDFDVQTNQTGKTVTLTWNNAALPNDRFSFILLNSDTGERIDMSATGVYEYTAPDDPSYTTHFRIIVTRLQSGEVTRTVTLTPGWSLVSAPVDTTVTGALSQLGDDLPMLNVYQFYDNEYYAGENADIQAGQGYWIYVADNTEIDITGVPVDSELRISLKSGWNLLGNPFETDIPWETAAFESDGKTMSLFEAVSNGMTNGMLLEYNGASYTPASVLKPWKGYFLKSAKDCVLLLKQQ